MTRTNRGPAGCMLRDIGVHDFRYIVSMILSMYMFLPKDDDVGSGRSSVTSFWICRFAAAMHAKRKIS